MVWRFEIRRSAAMLATVLLSSVILTGCVADTPRTELSWFPKANPAPRPNHVARNTPPAHHAPAPRHHHRPAPPTQLASGDCAPRQHRPAWYTQCSLPAPASQQPAANVPLAPAAGSLAFVWPVSGPIISDFGSTANGGRNDGINIAVPSGTPIRAAAAGQITYAGNELRGYGNLVLIKHDGGYVTAYAHADRISVIRNDFVAKGQIIGYTGQTGDVTSPQLHFEIRKGVQPVNPRSMLTTRSASAS